MDLLQVLILLVLAGLCGALAQLILGVDVGGLLVTVIIGVIGSYLMMSLARYLNLPALVQMQVGTEPIDIIWCVLGSLMIVGLLRLVDWGQKQLSPSSQGR